AESEENLFIAAACKETGVAFLGGRAKLGIRLKQDMESSQPPMPKDFGRFSVNVNGRTHEVLVRDGRFSVDGKDFDVAVTPGPGRASDVSPAPAPDAPKGEAVSAPMPGIVVRVVAKVGEDVAQDQPLLVLEAMKMEVEVRAPAAGRLVSLAVDLGRQVAEGDELARLERNP
ncbi:MAG: biotin/lipoyl-containing protein, partial [Desulfovibrio sp.]